MAHPVRVGKLRGIFSASTAVFEDKASLLFCLTLTILSREGIYSEKTESTVFDADATKNLEETKWIRDSIKNVSNLNSNAIENKTKDWLFKDYLNKYRPVYVLDRIEKRKHARGQNISMEKDFDEIFDAMDLTEDLLRVEIDHKPSSARRKWSPPGGKYMGAGGKDKFSMRHRFYELILHAMYWTRNKMVIMQVLRRKYRRHKLYKMGFMMSKADIACKMFHRFSYRAIHSCLGYRYGYMNRLYPIEILHAEERMNYKWFDIELLIDLITENDESCKAMLKMYDKKRLQMWKFTD